MLKLEEIQSYSLLENWTPNSFYTYGSAHRLTIDTVNDLVSFKYDSVLMSK